jgi:hypothetical protein
MPDFELIHHALGKLLAVFSKEFSVKLGGRVIEKKNKKSAMIERKHFGNYLVPLLRRRGSSMS